MSEKIKYSHNEELFLVHLANIIASRGLSYTKAPLDTDDTDGCELTVYMNRGVDESGEPKQEEMGAFVIIARGEDDPSHTVAEIVSDNGFKAALGSIARDASFRVLNETKFEEPGM